jgi:hypothetical protein
VGITLNRTQFLRGAFVEYGISLPPLIIPFQFNPLQISRSRSLTHTYSAGQSTEEVEETTPPVTGGGKKPGSLGDDSVEKYHKSESDLGKIQAGQTVKVGEETFSVELRLDATERSTLTDLVNLDAGIAPQLAALEKMVLPKEEGFFASLLPSSESYSFLKNPNPPLMLFIWGTQRILPVNITSLSITETEYNALLNPIRATVTVSMKVIEGKNPIYTFTSIMRDINAIRHLANVAMSVVDIKIPGP